MPEKLKADLYNYPNNPSVIDPKYPLQSILTESHMKNTLTSDMVSVTRAEGKIPIGDPNNDYKISLDWLGLSEDATYTVDASEVQKGVVKLASTDDISAGTDHTKAVTPRGLKWGIDNAFQNNLASTEQPGTVKLTNTIITNENMTGYKTFAVTSKAVKDYITDNLATDVVNFGDYNDDIKPIIAASKTTKYDVLATRPSYSKKSLNAYSLHRYISDNDLYFNVSNQSLGGIIFRTRDEDTSVSTVEKARLYINKTSGNFNLKVGPTNGVYLYQTSYDSSNKLTGSNNKEIILVDSSGNSKFPGTVTIGDLTYKNTSTTVGSATKPIYIKNGKITECNSMSDNSVADVANKLGTSTVGGANKPIYLNEGIATTMSGNIGDANTPVYISDGTITSTGKSFANYLPKSGGTLTGALTFANGTWNTVGDDVKIGDFNKSGLLGVMGANGTTGIAFCKKDDASNYKSITYDGTNLSIGGYTLLASVPANAKFTDTVTTVTSSGSGNAVTSMSATNGAITYTLGKTFSESNHSHSYLPLSGGTMTGNVIFKESNITRGTKPSAKRERDFADFKDSANNRIGLLAGVYYTDKSSIIGFDAYNTTAASGNSIGYLGIGCDSSGNVFTKAPTPPVGDDSTKIATTEWVKDQGFVTGGPYASSTHSHSYLPLSGGTVTGQVVFSKSTDLSGTAANACALVVGGAQTGKHMEFDANEIQTKKSGTETTDLYINTDGGNITLGNTSNNSIQVTAPTPPSGDVSKRVATTEFVKAALLDTYDNLTMPSCGFKRVTEFYQCKKANNTYVNIQKQGIINFIKRGATDWENTTNSSKSDYWKSIGDNDPSTKTKNSTVITSRVERFIRMPSTGGPFYISGYYSTSHITSDEHGTGETQTITTYVRISGVAAGTYYPISHINGLDKVSSADIIVPSYVDSYNLYISTF